LYTLAKGAGINYASVAKTEFFVIDLRDKFDNFFDAGNDVIHTTADSAQFIKCTLKTYSKVDPDDPESAVLEYEWPIILDYSAPELGFYRYKYQIMETFFYNERGSI